MANISDSNTLSNTFDCFSSSAQNEPIFMKTTCNFGRKSITWSNLILLPSITYKVKLESCSDKYLAAAEIF